MIEPALAAVLPDATRHRRGFLTDLLACFPDRLAPELTLLSGYRGWLQSVPDPRPPARVSVWWRSPFQPVLPDAASPTEFSRRRPAPLRPLLRHRESLLERLGWRLAHWRRQPRRR